MNEELIQLLSKVCSGYCPLDLSNVREFLPTNAAASQEIKDKRVPRVQGRIAVVPVFGVLSQHGGWFSQSMDLLQLRVRACCENPEIGGVVLVFHTPGGTTYGCWEAAARIREASQKKPVVGIANAAALSAGYALISSCSHIAVTPSGNLGSIGVYRMYINEQKLLDKIGIDVEVMRSGDHKIEANPWEEMTPEIRARELAQVKDSHKTFLKLVSKNRDIPMDDVLEFGQGLVYNAKDSLRMGLADSVQDFDSLLASMFKQKSKKSGNYSQDATDKDLAEWLQGDEFLLKSEATVPLSVFEREFELMHQ